MTRTTMLTSGMKYRISHQPGRPTTLSSMLVVVEGDDAGPSRLPLVFDDAFACSDSDRVCRLQRMLDHGAYGGLQIIVLTSNPSGYTGLGAHQMILRSTNQAWNRLVSDSHLT